MKTKAFTTNFAVIALMLLLGAMGAVAQTERQQGAQKPMQGDMAKMDMTRMDMSSMMNEPHHALAMAYMENIGTFAKTLNTQAEGSSPLDVKFARAAVAEIKRSLDQMEEHHGEHMKTMSAEMRSHIAAMMKDMESHRTMLKDAVSALEKNVRADRPDSKQIAADSDKILKHLDEMSKMQNEK